MTHLEEIITIKCHCCDNTVSMPRAVMIDKPDNPTFIYNSQFEWLNHNHIVTIISGYSSPLCENCSFVASYKAIQDWQKALEKKGVL